MSDVGLTNNDVAAPREVQSDFRRLSREAEARALAAEQPPPPSRDGVFRTQDGKLVQRNGARVQHLPTVRAQYERMTGSSFDSLPLFEH
jgi:hypothetical protein